MTHNKSIKKIGLISLLGSLFYLGVGWLVFDLLLGPYTEAHTTNLPGFKKNAEENSVLCLYISCLAYAVLITYILVFISNTQRVFQGFLQASLIGMLVATMTDTYWYGSSHFYDTVWVMILDIVAAGITVGLLGFVVTWLNIKFTKTK